MGSETPTRRRSVPGVERGGFPLLHYCQVLSYLHARGRHTSSPDIRHPGNRSTIPGGESRGVSTPGVRSSTSPLGSGSTLHFLEPRAPRREGVPRAGGGSGLSGHSSRAPSEVSRCHVSSFHSESPRRVSDDHVSDLSGLGSSGPTGRLPSYCRRLDLQLPVSEFRRR